MDNPTQAKVRLDEESRPRISGRPVRILLAEDDAEMRGLLTDSLRRDGYDVIPAHNGVEMIEEISMLLFKGDPLPVDLIVSDERMPGVSGLEFLSVLRNAEWPTPFILITGFGDEGTHRRAHQLGASAVFDKPFEIEEFKRTVASILTYRNAPSGNGGKTLAAMPDGGPEGSTTP